MLKYRLSEVQHDGPGTLYKRSLISNFTLGGSGRVNMVIACYFPIKQINGTHMEQDESCIPINAVDFVGYT